MPKLKKVLISVLLILIIIGLPSTTLAGVFGVGGYISSEPDSIKSALADQLADLGASITRTTINYGVTDWAPFDTGIELARARGIENLILLHYESSRPSVDEWGDFVASVASRYSGKIVGYEILNEADNYISGSDYASYLWRSYDKIKEYDSGAKVVVSGLTARSEATSFWNSLYSAGAWDKFDAIGLHPYRDSAPEVVAYNIGDFINSLNIAANWINSKGGGKKIWLTEFGVRSSTVGETNQANYIARSFILSRAVSLVEKAMMYRLRDGDNWGIVKSDLSHKELYDRYKNVISQFGGSGTAERIDVYDTEKIDGFDSVSGWETNQSSNGWATLSGDSGYSGGGMKMSYNFSAGSAYIVAEKEKTLSGNPVGLSLWAKGDTSNNVLKLRIKDSNNETFQFDMGKVGSSWAYYKFDFNNDSAKTSWGGNNNIDYPIKFESVVYDNQGGSWNGNIYLDELTSIKDGADLYAYKLGSKLAYWKLSGSKTNNACGKSLNFKEEPQITSVSDCSSSSSSSNTSSSTPSSSSSSTSSSDTPKEVKSIDKDKSKITLDKESALANGSDAITISIALKTANDEVIKSSKLALEVSGSDNNVGEISLVNKDHYEAKITSTKAEEKEIKVKIGSWQLGSIKAKFTAGTFSLAKSTIAADKYLANLGEEIRIILTALDDNGNASDIPAWQLVSLPVDGLTIIQPTDKDKNTAVIKVTAAGLYKLTAKINNDNLAQKEINLYVNPKLDDFQKIPAANIISLDSQAKETLDLQGKRKEVKGIKLTNLAGLAETDKVIIKIESTPAYFWLSKAGGDLYQGVMELPDQAGDHKLTVLKEDKDGNQTVLRQGTLKVTAEVAKKKTTPWLILGIILAILACGVAGFFLAKKIKSPRNKKVNRESLPEISKEV